MVDVVDKATRSRMMSGIQGKDTKPELVVRKFLHARGLRYRLHDRRLPGIPDLVFPKYRTVVFVHGCFWHQHAACKYATKPKSNVEFWQEKLNANVVRDSRIANLLRNAGWRIFYVWECNTGPDRLHQLLGDILGSEVTGQ